MTDDLVNRTIQSPGDPVDFHLRAEILPPIPTDLGNWLNSQDQPSLYLYGDHGVGKTWLAVLAGLNTGHPPGYWSERRFVQDHSRLRWFESSVNRGSSSNEIFAEFVKFELEFYRLALKSTLIIDELYYWGIQDYQQQELSHMIRNRFLQIKDQTTIIVASRLPEAGSPLRATVDNNFTIVSVP